MTALFENDSFLIRRARPDHLTKINWPELIDPDALARQSLRLGNLAGRHIQGDFRPEITRRT
jgi:hypothetical protein